MKPLKNVVVTREDLSGGSHFFPESAYARIFKLKTMAMDLGVPLVMITADNSDRHFSPKGMEYFDQVFVVGDRGYKVLKNRDGTLDIEVPSFGLVERLRQAIVGSLWALAKGPSHV